VPQISSQATRQAILVGDTPFDSEHPPDRLALYGPDGTILNAETLKGADGLPGPPGIPGLNWRGDFNESADYVVNDAVYHDGSTWRATIPLPHPAPPPSEEGALETNPVYVDSGDWPPAPVDFPFSVAIPDDNTAQWRYFDLLTPGDVTFSWDSDDAIFTAPYTTDGTSYGPGLNPPNPFTVTLPAGRIWVDLQDTNIRSTPNVVNMTIALSNGATAAPSMPWLLVAKKGEDGTDGAPGAPGAPGADGADGGPVPVGGTTGQLLAKVSDVDGDVVWEDPPVGGGSSGGGWVIAQDDTQIPVPTDQSAIGPELDFVVGASGMALLHASFEAFNGASTCRLGISIDGGGNIAEATINSGVAQLFSLGFSDAAADLVSSGGVAVRPGAMLRLAPGAHTVRFVAGASNSGGQARKFRLAAQAL
jgi:hypothetical protein